jgi:hypothetical protein
VFISGCGHSHNQRKDLFAEARHDFERGDFKIALTKCDEGLRETQHSNPALAYRFLLLKAETLIWNHQKDDAARLLAGEPPLPDAEFSMRRKMILANAMLPRRALEAKALLDEVRTSAANASPQVQSDLALIYAKLYQFLPWETPEERLRNDAEIEKSDHEALEIARRNNYSFAEAEALTK